VIEEADKNEVQADEEKEGELIIQGLPMWFKLFLSCVLILRILIAALLCWLGCRWLASTTDLGDVLSNAVALEFILNLNSLLYDKLMSQMNKDNLSSMSQDVSYRGKIQPSVTSYLSTFMWGIISAAWVYLYIFHLQMVIPGYQWDVKGPCSVWAGERYQFWRI